MNKVMAVAAMALLFCAAAYAENKNGDDLYKEKKYSEALEAYQKDLSGLEGKNASRIQMMIGVSLMQMGRHEEAIEEFRKVKDIEGAHPSYVGASLFRAGSILYKQKKYEEAIEEFRKVFDVEKVSVSIATRSQQQIGYSLRAQGKLDEAVAELRKVKEIFGSVASVYVVDSQLVLGDILKSQGKNDEAEKEYKVALKDMSVSFSRLKKALSNIKDFSDMAGTFVIQLKEGDEKNRELLIEKASQHKELAAEIVEAMPEDEAVVKALKPSAE